MRASFCTQMMNAARPELVFLTGDLGFKALEPLRDQLRERFINVGVAEQNMISVSAGLARSGLRPWAYSIAPFIYARPFEQIRNDVCLHKLPVVLVGNGGGYGYGVMGATHHAIEDYGVLLTLPHMKAYVPAFDADVGAVIERLMTTGSPSYLRLGLSEEPKGYAPPAYRAWRRLTERGQRGATVLVVGPLVGGILNVARDIVAPNRPALWVLTEMPISDLPAEFVDDVQRSERLVVVEEHVEHGGAGQAIAARLVATGSAPRRFSHIAAQGYPSGLYGSQKFHRKECGLDPSSIIRVACQD